LAVFVDGDGVERAGKRVWGLGEDGGIFGNLELWKMSGYGLGKIMTEKRWETNVAFFSVLAVVKAYAHDDVGLGDRTEELFVLSY
jgi:hypothetical protein